MKKIFLLLSAFLFAGPNLFAQWYIHNPIPQNKQLNSVCFADANTGFAVGDDGTILKTTNGGKEWTNQTSEIPFYWLSSVCVTDTNTAYAIGGYMLGFMQYGIILKTTNGGTDWTYQTSGTFYHWLSSVYFTDKNTGYAVGSFGIMLKTTDGGKTWDNQYSGTNLPLNSVYFVNANIGYAVGGIADGINNQQIIINTTDGGSTWSTQYSSTTYMLNAVCFTDKNNGYAVGGYYHYNDSLYVLGFILKTTNGGNTWDTILCGTTNWLTSVYFTNANTGYAVGKSGTIINTDDAGKTWTSQSCGISENLNSVFFTNNETGCAVGQKGTILKTTGGNMLQGMKEYLQTRKLHTDLLVSPNPANEKISIESSEQGMYLNGNILVYGMNGQEMIRQQANGSKLEINVCFLPKGLYSIKMMNHGKAFYGKFIKE